jgi:flagellar protein FlaI
MKVLETYEIESEGVPAEVAIVEEPHEYVRIYELRHTRLREATTVAINYLKEKIIEGVNIKVSEILDPREGERVKQRLVAKAHEIVRAELSGLTDDEERIIVGRLSQEMLGLGELELILADENLEELVVNSSREPVWVYHKRHGWLKSNIYVPTEEQIHNYSSIIGRRVGRQITNLSPLLDANLGTGDRVNATLFPISTHGNTITIRKFAKDPWTISNLITNGTITPDAAALIWLAMQYEMSMIVGGGTGSGKTSMLNSLLIFTPPNQRVITIEDTRELVLPEFLNWVPMSTRQPNPEGRGGVEMLDLMVNSLRMRPDRIVLGEIRRQREAEVLFEAVHTGHSVYGTLHADDASQVKQRLINPPISLPEMLVGSLQLILVQYRQRRTGVRRTYEIAELLQTNDGASLNIVYKLDAREDKLRKVGDLLRISNDLMLHTGMTQKEIFEDMKGKQTVLEAMVDKQIMKVNDVGRVIAGYYLDKDSVVGLAEKGQIVKLLLE